MNKQKQHSNNLKQAIMFFQQGEFNEADQILSNLVEVNPNNFQTNFLKGYIALLRNNQDAKYWLTKAIQLKKNDRNTLSLLAEFHYRQDEFQKAAEYLSSAGQVAKAQKLSYFRNKTPYQIKNNKSITINFVSLDPLPVIQVRINGHKPVNFFIDTGGGEIILDEEYAQQSDIHLIGSDLGIFGAGKKGKLSHGTIETLEIGDFIIKNIPVNVMKLGHALDSYFGDIKINGAIGTVFLYHFLSTLDYTHEQLILRPRTDVSYEEFKNENQSKELNSIPFWLCDDHFMVTWGSINQSKPYLFFVDTGLVGGSFTCPKSTIKEAKIHLDKKKRSSGMGGGGLMSITPFDANDLTLGSIKQKKIRGLYGPFPPTIEKMFGFHIGGLISHEFFKKYALTMDFDRMQYYLT